jgi:Glycosyl transferases group 1
LTSQRSIFSGLKIALIADEPTRTCLSHECRVMNLTYWNSLYVFDHWKPDLLLVESAWEGFWGSWRYGIASYPDHPERSNAVLDCLVGRARDGNVPTVFWNREDGVHFDRFLASASLFEHIFTVDENTIPLYRAALKDTVTLDVLMFGVQPAIHCPARIEPDRRLAFVGSYSRHLHAHRRQWQDMAFEAANDIGLTVYNRNSNRRSAQYRFPQRPWINVKKAIAHTRTADVYRRHIACLNVNTVDNSRTAFSRRLVEIIASGGLAVTNTTPAVIRHFRDFCEMVDDEEQARALFNRLSRDGWSPTDRERIRAGSDHVLRYHTWKHRLGQIMDRVN